VIGRKDHRKQFKAGGAGGRQGLPFESRGNALVGEQTAKSSGAPGFK